MNPPAPRDDELSHLLQSWKVAPPDDPQLAHKVWQRIEARPVSGFVAWFDHLAELAARPVAVFVLVLLFGVAGAVFAQTRIAAGRANHLDRLAREYVRSIDPVVMMDSPAP